MITDRHQRRTKQQKLQHYMELARKYLPQEEMLGYLHGANAKLGKENTRRITRDELDSYSEDYLKQYRRALACRGPEGVHGNVDVKIESRETFDSSLSVNLKSQRKFEYQRQATQYNVTFAKWCRDALEHYHQHLEAARKR